MKLEEYKKKYTVDDAPGWLAIDDEIKKLYGDQMPKHWASQLHFMVGGEDPIDGVSFYEAYEDGEMHYHFVTYGFTSLYYDEDHVGQDFSKFGFELTFRLKPYLLDKEGPNWVFGLIQNIARYVFKTGKWFEPYHYMPANGPIRLNTDTDITGLVFVPDPELGTFESPHGSVQFLQMFGVTDDDMSSFGSSSQQVYEFISDRSRSNPKLITDLG